MNDFWEDLEYSLDASKEQYFDDLYKRKWKNLDKIEKIEELSLQLGGIDKKLFLSNGRILFIDEKVRRKDYGDILLEEYSDFDKKKPGWLSEGKLTDYIAYAIEDIKKIYLLPVDLLRMAARTNWREWLQKYGRKFAQNKGYRTSFIAVPVEELLEAIEREMIQKMDRGI